MNTFRPTALENSNWLEAITHVLSLEKPTCLLICSKREDLLRTLANEVTAQSQDSSSPTNDASILHATIARISASRNVQVVFVPSLMHLRAYLSILPSESAKHDMLALLGLPDLHLSTDELSAQNLSRSLALAIEAASLGGMEALFLCPRSMLDHWEEDMLARQGCVWERRLPVLDASSRGGEDRVWSGRTIMMGNVFGQWCKVVKASQ